MRRRVRVFPVEVAAPPAHAVTGCPSEPVVGDLQATIVHRGELIPAQVRVFRVGRSGGWDHLVSSHSGRTRVRASIPKACGGPPAGVSHWSASHCAFSSTRKNWAVAMSNPGVHVSVAGGSWRSGRLRVWIVIAW